MVDPGASKFLRRCNFDTDVVVVVFMEVLIEIVIEVLVEVLSV